MKLPLPPGSSVRVSLEEAGATLEICGVAAAEGRIALEWAPDALRRGDDAGANLAVRQAPFVRGVHLVGRAASSGLPGFLADSLPDAWGRLLVDRQLRKRGIDARTLRGVDRLAIVGRRGTGALSFEPAVPISGQDAGQIDLDGLAHNAALVLSGSSPELLDLLEHVGGSAGGSRPKAWLAEDATGRLRSGAHALREGEAGWLVKFRSPDHDPEDAGPIEYAYARMAAAAGLEVPEPRLFETRKGRYFAGKRFDREGSRRIHVLTAAGFLDVTAEEAVAADYLDLVKLTRHVTRSEAEAMAAFRHATFNVLAHNRDDHLKQFAFVRREGRWKRSPAYDLTFHPGPGGEHTILVAGEGRAPGLEHLSLLARSAGLDERRAARVVDEVRAAVAHWPRHAQEAGVTQASRDHIASFIARR